MADGYHVIGPSGVLGRVPSETGRQIRDEHAERVLPPRARARMARWRYAEAAMSATALDLPDRPLADERESLAEEVRTVGMVWEREAIRFFRTRARILFGATLSNAACIGITCAFAAAFLALAVTGFGKPD